jgi:hypothetical protein
MDRTTERTAFRVNGFLMLFIILPAIAILALWAAANIVPEAAAGGCVGSCDVSGGALAVTITSGIFLLVALGGFTVLQPNEAQVLVFFGKYVGTLGQPFRETTITKGQ